MERKLRRMGGSAEVGMKGGGGNKVIEGEQCQGNNVGFKFNYVKQFSILVKHLLFPWHQKLTVVTSN